MTDPNRELLVAGLCEAASNPWASPRARELLERLLEQTRDLRDDDIEIAQSFARTGRIVDLEAAVKSALFIAVHDRERRA